MGQGEYLKRANRNVLVAVQIETVEGLENCEEIAKVEGVGESTHYPLVQALLYESGECGNEKTDWCGAQICCS